ncbi:MAG: hypothetical protein M1825_006191 [Sarcosagium campestre]|nr:MAG: hypothetical protein M1825_006191 [Sarcosagium campestre]
MVNKIVGLSLRVLEFFWTLLIIALVGNIIHDATAGNPSSINYIMFVAVISMLSLFYLIAATAKESFAVHPALPLGLDVLNALFFFIGGVVLAARLGVHSCGNEDYVKNNSITNGSENMTKRCHEAQAVTAFLWFGFLTYVASAVFSGLSAGGTGSGLRPRGLRRGPRSTSTV